MKIPTLSLREKTLLAILLAVAIGTIVAGPKIAKGDFDLQGLNQQVQHNTEQLNNHEARISNTEKDVAALQNNTNTAPAGDKAAIPTVSTPSATKIAPVNTNTPTSQPTPAQAEPVYITSRTYKCVKTGSQSILYEMFNYSDGTAKHLDIDPDNPNAVTSSGYGDTHCGNWQGQVYDSL